MSNTIIVRAGMDDLELENFNHKFSDTIVFDEAREVWVKCSQIDPGERHILHLGTPDSLYRFQYRTLNLKVDEVQLSKRSPERGFYNNFNSGECLHLARLPVRSYKHTASQQSITFNSRAWDLFPAQLTREVAQVVPIHAQGVTRLNLGFVAYVLNHHKLVSFDEAVAKVGEGDMISCAFHKHFMLSIGFFKNQPESLQLWYENVPIGMVNPTNRQITVTKLLLLQEIKDTLREQNCSWQVAE
jgi:hypothetical protein